MILRDLRTATGGAQHGAAESAFSALFSCVCSIVLAAVLVFAVSTEFIYDLWPLVACCAVLFALSVWMLIHIVSGHLRFAFSPMLVLLALPAVIGVAQRLADRTVYPFGTLLAIVEWSGAACAFWICFEIFQYSGIRRFRSFLTVFGIIVSVLAIVQLMTSNGRVYWLFDFGNIERPMASFLNRDRYSAFIELILPVVLFQALSQEEHWIIYALGGATMYASVVAGASRAGLLACTLEVLLAVVLGSRRGAVFSTRMRSVVVVLLLSAGLATAVGWAYVMNRFAESDPFAYRREFLISSVHMWRERPWLGFGLGSWPSVYPRFAIMDPGKFVNHAHNDWAEWADDGGLALFLVFLATAVRAARRALRSPEALGVTVVFLHSLVDFNFQTWCIVLTVAILLAAAESRTDDFAA